jgi:hypothetical protein
VNKEFTRDAYNRVIPARAITMSDEEKRAYLQRLEETRTRHFEAWQAKVAESEREVGKARAADGEAHFKFLQARENAVFEAAREMNRLEDLQEGRKRAAIEDSRKRAEAAEQRKPAEAEEERRKKAETEEQKKQAVAAEQRKQAEAAWEK